MKAFLQFPESRRLAAFQQVEEVLGLQAASVEKDFWVCWTLRALFSLPCIGEHLTFKGGTSLSKGWKLIQRFSEDIDIAVDKEAIGFGGDAAPDKAPSKKQLKIRLENLKEACRAWVQGTLQAALASHITESLGKEGWKLEVDPDLEDGQCLLFHYPTLFKSTQAGYVRPVVKIELGARSDVWPAENRDILPYVIEHFPALDPDNAFRVRVISPERTFWEKACLLHEETFRPGEKPRARRMARHYYDLWCLLKSGVGERAIADRGLFDRVTSHREIFFRISWVDYTKHHAGTFQLIPPVHHLDDWRSDYEQMQGPMFFGDIPPPTFDEIIAAIGEFERRFNTIGW